MDGLDLKKKIKDRAWATKMFKFEFQAEWKKNGLADL